MRLLPQRFAALVLAACWLGLSAVDRAVAGAPRVAPPEARALAYLEREVPRWSRENRCYSCHNNGDAARALLAASRVGITVPREVLADTTRWLARPEGWDHNGGEGPFSDKRLARVQFTAALAAAVESRWLDDRRALLRAADRLAQDQAADGSWPLEGGDALGSPATYGRPLATFMACEALRQADPARFRAAIAGARRWLLQRTVRNVDDAAVVLLASAAENAPPETRRRCLELLHDGQSRDGGWGPYTDSPPEAFDTALVLLALARSHPSPAPEVRAMLRRGRDFLVANQADDGSWPETTRPAGGESYAQRLSTTGWATLALLATRDR
jgi:hypothetical protein